MSLAPNNLQNGYTPPNPLPEGVLDLSKFTGNKVLQAQVQNIVNPSSHWSLNGYVFDCYLDVRDTVDSEITEHPLQTGAPSSDHQYIKPREWHFEIGMSDIAQSVLPGQFPASPTRSINALNWLISTQQTRQFCVLVSKYGTFSGVLIHRIEAQDNKTTAHGGRFRVTLKQPIITSVQQTKVSANPQITDITNSGTISPVTPSSLVQAGFRNLLLGVRIGGG